jgi:site-specific DNA recombinase
MKNVAAYVRVSTQEQADEGYSIGEQQDRLRKYCEAQGWNLIHIYTDPGFSGAKLDRPALQQLISDIPSGAFDTVLVFKLDRLSRSQKDTMYLLEDQFIKNNIDFCSVMESSLNTSTPLGKAMIGILSVFAQLERNNITERMTMGRIGRAKSGKHSGGMAPFGYDYIDGELVINEAEAVQVKLIFDLFLHGLNGKEMSLNQILSYLHERYMIRGSEWIHASTIPRILQNPVYCGMIKFSGKPYPGTHEAIIPSEEWERAQAKYQSYTSSFSETAANFKRSAHLLTGLIKCGLCGGNFGATTWKNRHATATSRPYYGYYGCRQRFAKVNKIKCGNAHYGIRQLEDRIIKEIRSLSLDPEELKAVGSGKKPSPEPPAYTAALKHLAEIDKQINKLLDLYQVDGIDISVVSARIKTLNEDKDRTNVILSEFESQRSEHSSSVDEAIEVLRSFDDIVASGDPELLRSAIRSLIDSIIAFPDHIEIHWSFA